MDLEQLDTPPEPARKAGAGSVCVDAAARELHHYFLNDRPWNRAKARLREITCRMLSAAPTVSPSGGQEEAQRVRDILYRDFPGDTPIGKTADDILAALGLPLAPASPAEQGEG